MNKGRLEAFSDGVFAIIITIMVLELHAPEGNSFHDLLPVLPKFISYILSFVYVAIYWTNHHHTFQVVKHVNGRVLWANILLLFLSVAGALCNGMDGRKSFCQFSCCFVWNCVDNGCNFIYHSDPITSSHSRKRLYSCHLHRKRFQRKNIYRNLCFRNFTFFSKSFCWFWFVLSCCLHLVHSGYAN